MNRNEWQGGRRNQWFLWIGFAGLLGLVHGRIRWLRPAFQNPQELLSNKELLPLIKRGLSGYFVQVNQYQIDSADGPWKPWAAHSRWRWVPRPVGGLDHKAMTHETHVSFSLTLQELRTAIDVGASSGRGADSEDVFERLERKYKSAASETATKAAD